MEDLRKPFFIVALILIALVVLIEIGSTLVPRTAVTTLSSIQSQLPSGDLELQDAFSHADPSELNRLASGDRPPGLGIPYMALLDVLVLLTAGLMGSSLFVPEGVQGRVQGCVTFIVALLLILGAIVLIFIALGLLILMLSLFLSVPFGTIAYLALFGSFNRGAATGVLSLLMLLKLGYSGSLVLAQQRFLQNKGFVLILLTSLLANVIISFLQGLVPVFLVSITDGVAAIIVAILAVLWAIFLLVGGVVSTVKAVT